MTTPPDQSSAQATPDVGATSSCAAVVPTPAWRCSSARITLVAVTVFSIVADLGSKWAAFRYIAPDPVTLPAEQIRESVAQNAKMVGLFIPRHDPVHAIPRLLDLTLVLNPGAVFGVAPGGRWFFVLFTAAALGFGLWMFGAWTRARDRWAHVALGLVIGGGLGNVYDRLKYGCVRDFIHPLPGVKFPFGWRPIDPEGNVWPYVSNVADLLLLIGIGILLVYLWRRQPSS